MKRIAFAESETESPRYLSLPSTPDTFMADLEEKSQVELKAAMLLNQLKARTPLRGLKPKATDRLLLDFFCHRIIESRLLVTAENGECDELMRVAEDWINGKSRRFLYEWEVQKNRQAYIEDMESEGKWKKMDEEHGEVGLQLEAEVFTSLVNELLDDLV